MNTSTDTIDTAALPRIAADEAMAAEAGLVFKKPTLFAHGTVLYDSGEKTYRRSRAAFDNRPLLDDSAVEALDAYKAQDRREYEINLHDLSMSGQGRVVYSGAGRGFGQAGTEDAVDISQVALGQMMSKLGAEGGAASYLMSCPRTLRAENVNTWVKLSDLTSKDKPTLIRTMMMQPVAEVTEVVERLPPPTRTAYAVLAPKYNIRDLPQVLPVFQEKLAALGAVGARGEYKLVGPKWKFSATFHAAIEATELRVGDIFRGVVWVQGVDDGTGSVRVGVGIERARCRNLTTIWARDVQGLRHNSVNFDQRLAALLDQAVKAIGGFAEKWAAAERDSIYDGVYSDLSPERVFGALVKRGLVKVPGVSKEEMVAALCSAWAVEPGYTRADIVNAVTRAAHETSWKSPWAQEELEAQGGQLLYNRLVLSASEMPLDATA